MSVVIYEATLSKQHQQENAAVLFPLSLIQEMFMVTDNHFGALDKILEKNKNKNFLAQQKSWFCNRCVSHSSNSENAPVG